MVNGFRPASLAEALSIRAEHPVTPYAGGTDLMVRQKPGQTYLFLDGVQELKQITADGEFVRIGAAVTFTQALESELVPAFMKAAVSKIAAPAIRNAGTFGGNLGNGSAKADSVLVEYAMDAKLRLISAGGERILPVEDFYQGRKRLALREDELIGEILLPRIAEEDWYYQKVGGRNALAISRVAFAGVLSLREGRIANLSAAFGAVADTVLRFRDLEAMLLGKTPEEARAAKAAYLDACAGRLALTEGRVSAAYRKTVCMNLLRDFLESRGL